MPPFQAKHRGLLESEEIEEGSGGSSSSSSSSSSLGCDGVSVKPLSLGAKAAFSVGHVLNDLSASVWFTYMLVYLEAVVDLGPVVAGNLILLGQVADAVFNPMIGYLSNKTNITCLRKCGRHKTWHLIGTICVSLVFPFILTSCLSCTSSMPRWSVVVFYAILIVIFQFGWAATQIAHLSLITELSVLNKERLELNAMRYGWTVISNIIVYGVTWGLFDKTSGAAADNDVQPGDAASFIKLALIVVGVGLFTTIMFYIGTPTPLSDAYNKHEHEREVYPSTKKPQIRNRRKQKSCKDWLTDPRFYVLSLLYVCARLIMNLTQVYIPFFVTQTLDLDKNTIATYPLVMCVFSFITATMMKFLANRCTSELLYLWGSLNVIGASLWMVFLQPHLEVSTFGTAILSGMGAAAVMVTSLSLVSEYIGLNVDSSSFIFGLMGFADKLANGFAVFTIQALSPCTGNNAASSECTSYFRIAIAYVPGGAAVVSLLVLAVATKLKASRKASKDDRIMLLDNDKE